MIIALLAILSAIGAAVTNVVLINHLAKIRAMESVKRSLKGLDDALPKANLY